MISLRRRLGPTLRVIIAGSILRRIQRQQIAGGRRRASPPENPRPIGMADDSDHCTILALTNWRKKYSVNSTDRNTVIQDMALPKPNLVSSIARRVI